MPNVNIEKKKSLKIEYIENIFKNPVSNYITYLHKYIFILFYLPTFLILIKFVSDMDKHTTIHTTIIK